MLKIIFIFILTLVTVYTLSWAIKKTNDEKNKKRLEVIGKILLIVLILILLFWFKIDIIDRV